MNLWEFNRMIESAVPWYLPFVVAIGAFVVVAVSNYVARKRRPK